MERILRSINERFRYPEVKPTGVHQAAGAEDERSGRNKSYGDLSRHRAVGTRIRGRVSDPEFPRAAHMNAPALPGNCYQDISLLVIRRSPLTKYPLA